MSFSFFREWEISIFCGRMFFSGITALIAFNRNAKGISDGPCRYKGVNGIYATVPEK